MDYVKAALNATRQIAKNGHRLSVVRKTISFGNSGNPISTVTASGELTAVRLPARKGTLDGFDLMHDKAGLVNEAIGYLLASVTDATFSPKLLDEVTLDGQSWVIRGIGILKPSTVAIIYKLGIVAV